MLERLIALYQPHVSRFVVVVSQPFVAPALECAGAATETPVDVCVQERPTGMLDAVLLARAVVEASDADRVWISWCDQIAIHPSTAARLADLSDANPNAGIVMPVVIRRQPYIHFDRDNAGRIVRVRHRREGDVMPDVGEGDAGLFSLSRDAYLQELPIYAATVERGAATGERNLLPFIPWMAARNGVVTFPCEDEMESVGINTQDDLQAVETYLRTRGR